jgi:HSP20 family protein
MLILPLQKQYHQFSEKFLADTAKYLNRFCQHSCFKQTGMLPKNDDFSYWPVIRVLLLVINFLILKTKNMNYNQSCAAKGEGYGRGARPQLIRSMQKAAVNIYKTDSSYEMLVFAPGRIKEHFKLDVEGRELKISYTPPEGFPRPNWVLREYSRGGFTRTFQLDETIDATSISAKYADGVLQVSLPLIAGKEVTKKEIVIN